MTRVLLVALAFVSLSACRAITNAVTDDSRAPVTRINATTWLVSASAGPAIVIGSSERITGTTGSCYYVATAAGLTHGMRCKAPAEVQVVTLGQVSASISNLPFSPAGKPAVPRP